MKAIIFFIFFTILTLPTVFGQIKIGDNPQNIDASSVLELESTSKVLVITRVTTLEMEAITPQRGGMVYNTDTECINYYDGTKWVNLCDAVDFNITNDPIINTRSTIEITESAGAINLEVAKNSILGDNIIDGGIGPDDIQDNSITQEKLADASVGSSELRQNSVGAEEIRDNSISVADMANDQAGQVLTTDENGIVQWQDSDDLYDLTFSKLDTTLTISRSTIAGVSTISLGALIGSDDQQLSLDENILSIENDPNTIDLSTYFQTISLDPDTNEIVLSGNGGSVPLPQTDGSETQLSEGNNITITGDGTADTPYVINAADAAIVDGTETVLQGGPTITITGEGSNDNPYIINASEVIALDNGNIFIGGDEDTAVQAFINGDATMNNQGLLTIEEAAVTPAKIEPALGVLTEDQVLITTTAGVVGWADYTPGGGDDNQDASEVAYDNTTSGLEAITTQAAIDELVDSGLVDTDDQDASEVDYDNTTSGLEAITTQAAIDELADSGLVDTNTTNATLTLTDEDLDSTIESLTITDSEGAKVSILLSELNSGTDTTISTLALTDENLDGIDDSLTITDSAGTTFSILLTQINSVVDAEIDDALTDFNATTGYSINVDDTTIEIQGDALQVKEDAIGLDQLNPMGADTNGQILKWNQTTLGWELGIDIGGTLLDGQVLIGNTADQATPQTLNGDATITNTGELTITTDAVENTMIAANVAGNGLVKNITSGALDIIPGTSDNQILKWDEATTSWELGTDDGGELPDGQVLIGDTNGAATPQTLSGDATITNTGELIIEEDAIDNTMIAANVAGNGLAKNITTGALDIIPGTTDNQILKWDEATTTWELDTDNGNVPDAVAGTIFFSDGSNALDIDETQLFWDNTENVLGVGTNTPDSGTGINSIKLHVSGGRIRAEGILNSDGSATTPAYRFVNDTDYNTGMYFPAQDQLGFSAGGQEVLLLKESAGNGLEIIAEGSLELTEQLLDRNGSPGNEGEILSATTNGTEWKEPQIFAMGKANGGNSINISGIQSISGGSGINTVNFITPRVDEDYIIQLTVLGNNRIYVTSQTIDGFTVEIRNATTGNLEVANWFFTVSDF
ncbi:beta strand repeat-containing protein [Maribacter sp. Asnod1-A12]|uniref:beta strand repeat-containing protein n=1 Tax=Maribacter sp. Asnod1-A12 TaxID=3160576 RepID=UPI00386E3BF9